MVFHPDCIDHDSMKMGRKPLWVNEEVGEKKRTQINRQAFSFLRTKKRSLVFRVSVVITFINPNSPHESRRKENLFRIDCHNRVLLRI
ncbi:hypothetical protein CEXT_73571 [Caerostris extrusa]|uniref:Uncharacterized protein n=1 Tax=Caerostris extrusa TaxID=172846 RepID=A0AAV4W1F7_CAEEX|nr:hypothetical protein CEXT_73571 [Caerostris extrusa]